MRNDARANAPRDDESEKKISTGGKVTNLTADKIDEQHAESPHQTQLQLNFPTFGLLDLGKNGLKGSDITEDLVHWCIAFL